MIHLTEEQYCDIVNHAKSDYPKEACGILVGKVYFEQNQSMKKITKVYKMVNTSDNPETCYFMKPEEQLKVFKETRQLEIEMIGIYHSHSKSPAYPSQRDCEMAFYPEASYVIVSLQDFHKPEVRAFEIIESKIEEKKIVVRKNILFVCVENSCRSQMAEAIVNNLYWEKFIAYSAGSKPSGVVNPLAIEVMEEIGIDISKQKPKTLTQNMVEKSELIITMGCIKGCPLFKEKKIINWDIENPTGKPLEKFKEIREVIAKKIKELNRGRW